MKLNKSVSLWLAVAAVAFAASVMPASATTPQNLDIHVSISNTKDLTVDATYYNFGPLAVDVVAAVDGQLGAPICGVKCLPVAILGRRILHGEEVRRIVGRGAHSDVSN